jgi:SAM-dependent methyltransferase
VSRAYSADLAYIHDSGFSAYAREAAEHLLSILQNTKKNRRSDPNKHFIVDLGCGSGIMARELLRAGCDVLGIDISRAMIRLARKKAPQASFIQGSFRTMQLPSCDAVVALGEVLNYEFDPHLTRSQLSRFFRRVHAALRRGGVFIFDVAGPGRAGSEGKRQGCLEGKDWAILFLVEEDTKRQQLTRTITSFRRVGKLYRRTREIHEQRLYSPSEIAEELRQAGFRVKRLPGYGCSGFPEGLAGFVAHKDRA